MSRKPGESTVANKDTIEGAPLLISYLLGTLEKPRYLRPPKPDTTVTTQPQCLYCLKFDGPFTSQEHIIPEGLGNKHLVLPQGVACDPCNNGPLSVLDSEFLNFMPVAMMRAVRGVPTKEGKLPEARFGNASVRRAGAGDLYFETNSRKAATPIPGGVNWSLIGRKMTETYTAQLVRWMFKAALGLTYMDQGRIVALSPKFDEVRRVILGGPFHGYLALANKAKPHESVAFTHWPLELQGKTTVWIVVDVFGIVLSTDMFVRRADHLDPDPERISVIEF